MYRYNQAYYDKWTSRLRDMFNQLTKGSFWILTLTIFDTEDNYILHLLPVLYFCFFVVTIFCLFLCQFTSYDDPDEKQKEMEDDNRPDTPELPGKRSSAIT